MENKIQSHQGLISDWRRKFRRAFLVYISITRPFPWARDRADSTGKLLRRCFRLQQKKKCTRLSQITYVSRLHIQCPSQAQDSRKRSQVVDEDNERHTTYETRRRREEETSNLLAPIDLGLWHFHAERWTQPQPTTESTRSPFKHCHYVSTLKLLYQSLASKCTLNLDITIRYEKKTIRCWAL